MNKVFKYRIYANQSTIQKMEQWISFCRRLYNLALEQRVFAYTNHRKSIHKFEQMRQITQLRKVFPEYNEINADALHNVIKRLDRAYGAFFRRIKVGEKAGFPRFKGEDRYNSITFSDNGYRFNGKYLNILKVGIFKIKLSRSVEGEIKEVTLIKKAGNKWFVCFVCGEVQSKILPKTNNQIGIDVGCNSFLTDSNGKKVNNPKFLEHSQKLLTTRQRKLELKKRGSNRRKKAKILVIKAHEKVTNQRKDFHYKVANELLKNNDVICIEKLKSWNTYRSLNRSMRDVAWFQFFSILRAKAEEAGREIIEVPAKNTSQLCSACGQLVPKELKDRIHNCSCGLVIDRDINAARNILRFGQNLHSVSPLKCECA